MAKFLENRRQKLAAWQGLVILTNPSGKLSVSPPVQGASAHAVPARFPAIEPASRCHRLPMVAESGFCWPAIERAFPFRPMGREPSGRFAGNRPQGHGPEGGRKGLDGGWGLKLFVRGRSHLPLCLAASDSFVTGTVLGARCVEVRQLPHAPQPTS